MLTLVIPTLFISSIIGPLRQAQGERLPRYPLMVSLSNHRVCALYPELVLPSNEFSGGRESNGFLQSRGFEIAECSCGGAAAPMTTRTNVTRPVEKTPLKPQTHQSERCKECKTRVRQLLDRIYGKCLQDHQFPWPARLSGYVGTPVFSRLQHVLSNYLKTRFATVGGTKAARMLVGAGLGN